MPLKLSVGLSRKMGLPNYGSLGASCALELELDQALLEYDPETFSDYVRQAYSACQDSVSEELARQQRIERAPQDAPAEPAAGPPVVWPGAAVEDAGRAAPPERPSPRQLAYLRQLSTHVPGLGPRRLDELAQALYRAPLGELDRAAISGLIDTVKNLKRKTLELGDILEGDAA